MQVEESRLYNEERRRNRSSRPTVEKDERSPILDHAEGTAADEESGSRQYYKTDKLHVGLCSYYGVTAVLLGANTLSGMMATVQSYRVADEYLFPGRDFPINTQTWMSRWQVVCVALTLMFPRMNTLKAFKFSMRLICACEAFAAYAFIFLPDCDLGYHISVHALAIACGFGCLAISAVLGLLSRIDGALAGHAGVGIGLSGVIAMLYAWPVCMLNSKWHGGLLMSCGTLLASSSMALLRGLVRDPVVAEKLDRQDQAPPAQLLPLTGKIWAPNLTAFISGLTLFMFYPSMVVRLSKKPFVIATLFGLHNVGEILGRLIVSGLGGLHIGLSLVGSALRFGFPIYIAHLLDPAVTASWRLPRYMYIAMTLQGLTFGLFVNAAFIGAPNYFELQSEKEAAGLIVGSFNAFGILSGTMLLPYLETWGFYPPAA